MINPFKNKYFNIFILLLVLFCFTRFLTVGQIYHQDEYRWAVIANPIFNNFSSPHPPLTRYLLRFTGEIFGFDHLRVGILFFSFLNFFLLYAIIKKMTGKASVALLGLSFFVVSVYSAIANVQIDIDGATLPFWGLLMFYAYLHILKGAGRKWWALLGFALIGGFLTKVSFVLFLAALVVDYFFVLVSSEKLSLRSVMTRVLKVAGGLFLVGFAFYALYASRLSNVIQYAEHFKSLDFSSRAYADLAFKLMKSLVWLSPLLFFPVLAGLWDKVILQKYRFWYLYLFFNLVFYLVLFDFSNLTIERYFMFAILPCIIIAAEVAERWLKDMSLRNHTKKIIFLGVVLVLVTAGILAMPHSALPLNPKSAYVDHIASLNFNFLLPLTGGSGPVGFYFSATYILFAWIVSGLCAAWLVFQRKGKGYVLIVFLLIGFGYNALFLNEYIFGSVFGSVPRIAHQSVQYVESNPKITSIITYYDIGAYDLTVAKKYYSRFYTAPSRDYSKKLTDFRGQYMIVDFPGIDKTSAYWKLIERCPLIKQFNDKQIHSYIFDCQNIK